MSLTTAQPLRSSSSTSAGPTVLVACPDARPPAYQAVVGLAQTGMLSRFVTAFYDRGSMLRVSRLERLLSRRRHHEIPADRVASSWAYDFSLAVENRLGSNQGARRRLARARTCRFDGLLARTLERERPEVALVFSDVGSEVALPLCRERGIGTIVSMVHGDVREEMQVLEREAATSPDFFPLYLGEGAIDFEQLRWLHARRLRDLELADCVLVPSAHIAKVLQRHGTPAERIRVIPYAADTARFAPDPCKRHGSDCTFLFAGGISQRKGIKYLLDAWRLVRRDGWRLQLLGAAPRELGPLAAYRDELEWLGRVGHSGVPALMARADVFVFPSLFEGSAVVTYEALACGLPSIVTAEAGSVVREGVEGFVVPAADVATLATRMECLGGAPDLRAAMSAAARRRALEFAWPRYHTSLIEAVTDLAAVRT